MTKYLLSVCYPADAVPPSPDELATIGADVDRLHREMVEAGVWVFGGGLHEASSATVVTSRGGRVLLTDGPFTETKEQLGGLTIVDVRDLDAALYWAERAAEATTCPIEVRPFQDG